MKKSIYLLLLLFSSCIYQPEEVKMEIQGKTVDLELTKQQAESLVVLPLKCVEQEYPNKLGQVLEDSLSLLSPRTLHPAFFGCFDWHSSVHGHWLMVRLVKEYPTLKSAKRIRAKLRRRLTDENIAKEVEYFSSQLNSSFERTYGWGWLLRLQQELDSWDDSLGKQLAKNLEPLSDLIQLKYEEFIPKLKYPIRSGEHVNSAFGLSFAYDYAVARKDTAFQRLISEKAIEFYKNDKNAQLSLEPSGFDFLSPIWMEAELMCKILPEIEFIDWFEEFLPAVSRPDFRLAVGEVSDRNDGKLVHIDGLNFSRAWCMYEISRKYPRYMKLKIIADKHLAYSLPSIIDGNYMGEHWLASFATYALIERNKKPSTNADGF